MITCSIKQCRQMTPLCLHCWGGLGWQFIRGVNISNVSPKYLQPERVISGTCNYPPGYLPSDPPSGQSIVLGSPSILAYLNDYPFIPCHSSQSTVNCLFLPPISTTSAGLELCDSVYDSTDVFVNSSGNGM